MLNYAITIPATALTFGTIVLTLMVIVILRIKIVVAVGGILGKLKKKKDTDKDVLINNIRCNGYVYDFCERQQSNYYISEA